jgi:hypothetical protein
VFFSHNKSGNNIFSHDFLVKRMGLQAVGITKDVLCYKIGEAPSKAPWAFFTIPNLQSLAFMNQKKGFRIRQNKVKDEKVWKRYKSAFFTDFLWKRNKKKRFLEINTIPVL